MGILTSFVALMGLINLVVANTEKTIFRAPLQQPVRDASIDNLLLVPLSPRHTTARTWLNATFPTKDSPRGTDNWMLLEGLTSGTRYELRVCWLATQPTEFRLRTHTLEEVFEDPALLSSLTVFSNTRRANLDQLQVQQLQDRKHKSSPSAETASSSLLFLQISASADYYSLNTSLMEQVPPVFVDVILDQYIFNAFPESLVPTAGYIIILAIGSWFLSSFLWRSLSKAIRPKTSAAIESKKIQ